MPGAWDSAEPRRRVLVAALASVLLNLATWSGLSVVSWPRPHVPPPPIEVERIVVPPPEPPPPPPPPPEQPKPTPPPQTPRPARPLPIAAPPPEPIHNRVLTAPETVASAETDGSALAGGNAPVGVPVAQQIPEPVAPPTPVPSPAAGPTIEAEAVKQVQPTIPDELKRQELKSFVRVRVDIAPDGSFAVAMRSSSGNAEIDRRVQEALAKWRWKPALQAGVAVASTQLFKFEFEVR
jgi:protein TonB